jgi:hypothetical protein
MTDSSVEDAISEFTDELINKHGHAGYENNDGGGGELIISVESGNVELNHYDNIVQQEYSRHNF